jgi:hypothetical protein
MTEYCNGGDLRTLLIKNPNEFNTISFGKMYIVIFFIALLNKFKIGVFKLPKVWFIFILKIFATEI